MFFTLTKRVINGQAVYHKRSDDFHLSHFGRKISEAQYLKERAKFTQSEEPAFFYHTLNEPLRPYNWLPEFLYAGSRSTAKAKNIVERFTYEKPDRPWPEKEGPLIDL